MVIQVFIEKAIGGGYPDPFPWMQNQIFVRHRGMGLNTERKVLYSYVLLDPEAWKAVGKVEGWPENEYHSSFGSNHPTLAARYGGMAHIIGTWQYHMHRMIDALAEGKHIEQCLETL